MGDLTCRNLRFFFNLEVGRRTSWLALSVCMTAISTCFAVVSLPANLLLYTHLAYGFDVRGLHVYFAFVMIS